MGAKWHFPTFNSPMGGIFKDSNLGRDLSVNFFNFSVLSEIEVCQKKKCQRVERTWSRIRRIPSSKLEYFQICCWQPLFVASSCQQMFVASRWKVVSANVPTCPSLDLKASKEREGEAIPFYAVIAVFVGDIVSFESKRAKRRSFMQIFV